MNTKEAGHSTMRLQKKNEKAIIFICIDTWGNEYKFVVICDENEVNAKIKEAEHLSTEITDYEVCDAYRIIE